MSGYAVAHLEDIQELDDGRCPLRPVRHHFGISSFGINAWTGRNAGDRVINEHAEDEPDADEELYLVVTGRAVFELDGEKRDAPAGTFVFVKPGVRRTAFAEEPGTTILAVGGSPGRAYEVGGWELWSPMRALYDDGRYDEAADRAQDILRDNPDQPMLLYNVACVESLAGRTDDAIAHLGQAIELSDRCRDYAQGDSDFDPIRDEAAFKKLVR
jgi:tetratricopeptide (TPR) repeat protein